MAKNATDSYVHVHGEGGTVTIVGPGEEFPKGFDADPSLTKAADEDHDVYPIPGPGQTVHERDRGPRSSEVPTFQQMKVQELRDQLAAANVDFADSDRKDALVAKAEAAGLDPAAQDAKAQ